MGNYCRFGEDRAGKDVQHVRAIKDAYGNVLTCEEDVLKRWFDNFRQLMNEENRRERKLDDVGSCTLKVTEITEDEVRAALKRTKNGKAVGPDDLPVEAWRNIGEMAVKFLTRLFNKILTSKEMPGEWTRSVLVPIFKNKGVQNCNYRGIKLMSQLNSFNELRFGLG